MQRHARLELQIVLSRPSGPTARRVGLLSDAILEDLESFADFKAYVAGPPAMVETTQLQLEARGMAIRDIHADAFYDQAQDAFNLG